MSLATMNSDLTKLKFGKDRPNGGSSNQPYIRKDPNGDRKTGGRDFLIRGGTLSVSKTADDVERVTKMFGDLKSPNGILFTAKQNLLSRVATLSTKNQLSQVVSLGLNDGVYLPTSTILSTALLPTGIKLNKQGINPFRNTSDGISSNNLFGLINSLNPLSIPLYYDKDILTNEKLSPLYNFTKKLKDANGVPITLMDYAGGPGSIIGIGRTIIKSYNFNSFNFRKFASVSPVNFYFYKYNIQNLLTNDKKGGVNPITLNNLSRFLRFGDENNLYEDVDVLSAPESNKISDPEFRSRDKGNLVDSNKEKIRPSIPNFRNINTPKSGDNEPLDYLNATPIYSSSIGKDVDSEDGKYKDLIKFRIGIFDNDDLGQKEYIHFRAYITTFSNPINASWTESYYAGRGEPSYSYQNTKSSISLNFQIAAMSKSELEPIYFKLNHMVSAMHADYSQSGFKRGSIFELTLGDYCLNQPGILNSFNISPIQDSPWELEDGSQLPFYLDVSGFEFSPIYNFVPQRQKLIFNGGEVTSNDIKFIQ
jgi:hypothetical protein